MPREIILPSSAQFRATVLSRLRQGVSPTDIIRDLMVRYPRSPERLVEREVDRLHHGYLRARRLLDRDFRRNVHLRPILRCRAGQRVRATYEVRYWDSDSGRERVFTFQTDLSTSGRLYEIVREPLRRLSEYIGQRYASQYISTVGLTTQSRDRSPGFTILTIDCV